MRSVNISPSFFFFTNNLKEKNKKDKNKREKNEREKTRDIKISRNEKLNKLK